MREYEECPEDEMADAIETYNRMSEPERKSKLLTADILPQIEPRDDCSDNETRTDADQRPGFFAGVQDDQRSLRMVGVIRDPESVEILRDYTLAIDVLKEIRSALVEIAAELKQIRIKGEQQ